MGLPISKKDINDGITFFAKLYLIKIINSFIRRLSKTKIFLMPQGFKNKVCPLRASQGVIRLVILQLH